MDENRIAKFTGAQAPADLERLESKIDALHRALGAVPGPEIWPELPRDADSELHSSALHQYWVAVRLHKGAVLVVAFVGLLAGLLFTVIQTPEYRARGTLEIVGLNENFLNSKEVDPIETGNTSEPYIQTQAEILASTGLVAKAVTGAKMDHELPAAPPNRWSSISTALGLHQQTHQPTAVEQTRIAIAHLKVEPRRGTHLIDIEYDDQNPSRAANFVNALSSAFLDYAMNVRAGASHGTATLLNRELEGLEEKLRRSETQLQDYARNKHLIYTDDKATVAEEKLREMQTELSKAQTERISHQSQYEIAQSSTPEALPEVLDSGTLRDYQSKLAELRRQLAEMKAVFTPEYSKVKRIQAQISELEDLFNKERQNTLARIKNDYDASLRREHLLDRALSSQTDLVSAQSADAVTYNLMKGQVDTYKRLYDDMMQKAKSAGLASAMSEASARIVEPAETPQRPYKPNAPLNCAVGLLSGVLAGVVLVVVRHQADRTVKNPGDCPTYLNLPELAVIPALEMDPVLRQMTDAKRWKKMLKHEPVLESDEKAPGRVTELAVWRHKPSLMAESFRALLTSILFSSRDERNLRTIVITSSGPSEGKSTISSNLAITMSEVRQRVLLVDADARKPRIHEIFGLSNEQGLTTILAGRNSVDYELLKHLICSTHVPGLYVLTSGPNHERISTLLHSPRLSEMLLYLRQDFDLVLIDTPPVLHFADARILGRRADTALLVARAASTTRDALQAAKQRLNEDGVPVLGVVLNDWHPKTAEAPWHYNVEYYQSSRKASA